MLCLHFKAPVALEIDADLPGTGVTALFGPSGCGKTSTLRAIAGLNQVVGEIRFDDELWVDSGSGLHLDVNRRPVGYVFQDRRLFTHLDVAGNLAFAEQRNRSAGINKEEVIAMLGLDALLSRSVADLSGGEQQRVAIGRALLTHPRLLLLDEPFAALDHAAKAELLPYIRRTCADLEIAAILVTHNLDEVAELADHVLVMDEGTTTFQGTSGEFFATNPSLPESDSGSLLTGHVVSYDSRLQIADVKVGFQQVALPSADPVTVGSSIRLFVKTRDVSLALGRLEGISVRNILASTIVDLRPLEGTPFTEVDLAVEGQHLSSRVTRASAEELQLEPGQELFALIKSVSIAS